MNKSFLSVRLAISLAVISSIGLAISVAAGSRDELAAVPEDGLLAETTVTPTLRRKVSQQTDQDIKVKLVTLTPEGFEPDVMHASKGRFVLAIHDLSRLDETNIKLNRVNGNKLHEVRLSRGKKNESKALELTPGEYVLTEANHPRWVCKITVKPR